MLCNRGLADGGFRALQGRRFVGVLQHRPRSPLSSSYSQNSVINLTPATLVTPALRSSEITINVSHPCANGGL